MNKKFLRNAVLALTLSAGIFSTNFVEAKPIINLSIRKFLERFL